MAHAKFSGLINQLIDAKKVSVNQLLSILNITKGALYRRLRGEMDFNLSEAYALANALHFSLDALNHADVGYKTFMTKRFLFDTDAETTATKYLSTLLADMQRMHANQVQHLFYAAKDLPLFSFFSSPTLTPFKLYFWYITIFDSQAKRAPYNPQWLPKKVQEDAASIYKLYNEIDSTEIWNFETIVSTLHQILYCVEAGLLNKTDALQLLIDLEKFVDTLEENLETGHKQIDSKQAGQLKLYLNEILLLDNSVMFELPNAKVLYMPYQTLNFLSTMDADFVNQSADWFNKQISKSTLLSNEGQRDRDKLINNYRQEIKRYRNKLL
jgi:transcriptional regulator with XRE-family HTH domain